MMDLGLGGFIEKFESYFGKWPTFILMLLVGLAVASTCVNLIFIYTVKPIYDVIAQAIRTQAFGLNFIVDLSQSITLFSFVIILATSIVGSLLSIKSGQAMHAKTAAVLDCLEIAQEKLRSTARNTKNKKLLAELEETLADIRERLKSARSLK